VPVGQKKAARKRRLGRGLIRSALPRGCARDFHPSHPIKQNRQNDVSNIICSIIFADARQTFLQSVVFGFQAALGGSLMDARLVQPRGELAVVVARRQSVPALWSRLARLWRKAVTVIRRRAMIVIKIFLVSVQVEIATARNTRSSQKFIRVLVHVIPAQFFRE
jgi:hypothetical protein